MRSFAPFVLLLAFACNSKDVVVDTTDTDDTDDTDEEVDDTWDPDDCDNPPRRITPEDGATGVFYRSIVEVQMTAKEDDLTLTITGPDGDVPGELVWTDDGSEGGNAVFEFHPDDFFAPISAYEPKMQWSCGSARSSFETGTDGQEVGTTCLDTAIAIDLKGGTIVKPTLSQEALDLIWDQIPEALVEPIGVDGSALTMKGASSALGSSPPVQDLCQATTAIVADWRDPYFAYGPANTTVAGLTVYDLELDGDFAPDCSITHATMSAFLDLRPIVGDGLTLAFACGLIGCVPCSDGASACLDLEVEDLQGEPVDDLHIVDRTSADIASDPSCQ